MWCRRSKHVFGQRTQISWTACGCMLCSVTPPGTWLDKGREKWRGRACGGGGVLGKTRRSSIEQTDSISPRLCTQRQTGKGSGEEVSNLFPELWQSITCACCSDWTLHWMDVMRIFFTPPRRAWWHHPLMKLITRRQRFGSTTTTSQCICVAVMPFPMRGKRLHHGCKVVVVHEGRVSILCG